MLRCMTTDDGEQWGQAQAVLDRAPAPAAEEKFRKGRRLVLLIVGGSLVLGAGLGVLLGVLLIHHAGTRSHLDVPVWRTAVGLALALAALVAETWQLRELRRSRQFRPGWRGPLVVLTRQQRKELLAEVRGQRPADPEHLPLARYLAQRLSAQAHVLGVYGCAVVLFLGIWIATGLTALLIVIALWVVLIAVTGPLLARQVRQARRFLEEHPATR